MRSLRERGGLLLRASAAWLFAANGLAAQCPEPIPGFYAEPEIIFDTPIDPPGIPRLFVGDFNADTYDDILWTYVENHDFANEGFRLWILLNDQAGGFVESAAAIFNDPIPSDYGYARDVFIEDFNGDLQDDILITSHGLEIVHNAVWPGERLLLFLSQSDHTYSDASAQFSAYSYYTHGASVGDIDGDGDVDIFDPHNGPDDFPLGGHGQLWQNDGSGSFTDITDRMPKHPVFGDIAACWSSIFDATGDGYGDILLLASTNFQHRPKTWINDGSGDFDRYVFNTLEDQLPNACFQEILKMSLNDDGLGDIVVQECDDGFGGECYLGAYTSNGDGTFANETESRFPDHPVRQIWTNIRTVEINGDASPDIAAAIIGADPAHQFFVNDGSGVFRLVSDGFGLPEHMLLAKTLDVDGDGGNDFISECGFCGSECSHNNICLWRQQVPYQGNIIGTEQCNKIVGGSAVDTFDGAGGDDELLGGDNDDTLMGGADNDRLFGENGNDTLLGGTGTDTAGFRGPRRDYLVDASGSPITVTHVASATVDSLTDIETLEFTDMVCSSVDTASDADADGAPDGCDLCPGSSDTADADGDGIPDGCDICAGDDSVDSDGDGIPDACDPCFGDSSSGDSDTDGVCDDSDLCPGFPDENDLDNDSVPDDCDICASGDDRDDYDGDGVPTFCDPCIGPDNSNDADGDGVCDGGDLCALGFRNAFISSFCIFSDDFESGDTGSWERAEPN